MSDEMQVLATDLRRVAAAVSVAKPGAPTEPWGAFRPGDETTRQATPAEVQAFTEASAEQVALAFGLLDLGTEAAAVGLDLLYETAAAATDLGRAAEVFNGKWSELQRLLTWAAERMETT